MDKPNHTPIFCIPRGSEKILVMLFHDHLSPGGPQGCAKGFGF
jgi:hypothetical protein